MIRTLRRRFVATNMLLVSIVLLIVFAVQTFSAYQQAREQVYQIHQMSLNLISKQHVDPAPGMPGFIFEHGRYEQPENTFFSIPTFSVEVDESHQIIRIAETPGVSVTEETAQALVDTALKQNSSHGTIPGQSLSYLYRFENNRRFFSFADNSSVADALKQQILTSLLVGALALLGFFLISLFLSKLSVAPVEKAWKQQRQFVADASHELKTPLTVITTNAELLHEPECGEERRQQCSSYILAMSRQMQGLVESLLHLARADDAEAKTALAPLDFSQLAEEATLPFEPLFFEHDLILECAIQPDIRVNGDTGKLRQVIEILLDNANKYSTPLTQVRLELKRGSHGTCLLSVTNQGETISKDDLKNIFKRFYRVDAARSMNHSYGLGLPIAEAIVLAHKGKIWAESNDGVNTFFVRLPMV